MKVVGFLTLLSFVGLSAQQPSPAQDVPIHVFLADNGQLEAGHRGEQNHTIRWQAANPKISQFWIKFDHHADDQFCQGVTDGVLPSSGGEAVCKVAKESDKKIPYRIYSYDPRLNGPHAGRHHRTPPLPPPPPQQFVWSCKGC